LSVRVAITLLLSLVAVSSILGCDRDGSGNFKLDPVPELERSMKAAEPFDFAKIVDFQPKSICWNTLPMDLFTKFRDRLRTDPWYAKSSAGYLIEHGQYYLRIFIVGENDVRYVDIQNARPNIPRFFFRNVSEFN
jgi:hypothetical protein